MIYSNKNSKYRFYNVRIRLFFINAIIILLFEENIVQNLDKIIFFYVNITIINI